MNEPRDLPPASIRRTRVRVQNRATERQPIVETVETDTITEHGVLQEIQTDLTFCAGCSSLIREISQAGARCCGCGGILCSTNECWSIRCESATCRQSVCPSCRGEAFGKTYCEEHLWPQYLLGALAVLPTLFVLIGLALFVTMVVGPWLNGP